ncbi:hypothetical protein TWF694_010864 [Orbilia ellipsospora]|uniref:alpha-1,2-Mannosidase n=1 Tax=Orbilia ellipsospora TaxID=2528407 RepID=A0AAV9X8J0_9PEZI
MTVLLFRVRRYRVLLLFTAFVIALWYHFSPADGTYDATDEWLQPTHDRGTTKEQLKSEWSAPDPDDAMPPAKGNPHTTAYDVPEAIPTPVPPHKPGGQGVPHKDATLPDNTNPSYPPNPPPSFLAPPSYKNIHAPAEPDYDQPHWTKIAENFPVPSESIIPLPTGNPKTLPRIQYNFKTGSESNTERNERLERQGAVKDAFKHAWEGYRAHAWGHDEVTPVSGGFKDPFAGWAATLVDALDTMAIMGLHAEFEEALTAVKKIDFTTTHRMDIPMFETTIRYLGGLLGAYDVTGQKHKILLDKAKELAEILYNAFDTPNRMPVLYFQWQPENVKQRHRASTTSCMAEIGSMSVEFTRLAQLTGENKYFDAIQRITNEFDKFLMNTTLPGFWPQVVDASGCQMVDEVYTKTITTYPTPTEKKKTFIGIQEEKVEGIIDPALDAPPPKMTKVVHKPTPKASEEDQQLAGEKTHDTSKVRRRAKRAAVDPTEREELEAAEGLSSKAKSIAEKDRMAKLSDGLADLESQSEPRPKKGVIEESERTLGRLPESHEAASPPARRPTSEKIEPIIKEKLMTRSRCIPSGFRMNEGEAKYTYGGMSDSTYEYLLKEHILLGGLAKQYSDLYIKTYETARSNLFFRPMVPKNKDILVSGDLKVNYDYDRHEALQPVLEGAGSHLTCFVGGMIGMGAKILERPEDLEVAMKLTDGCVWNYFSTASGIMPENFIMAQCPKTGKCNWDRNLWLSYLIPPDKEAIAIAKTHDVTLVNPFATHSKRGVSYDGAGGKDVSKEDPPPPKLPGAPPLDETPTRVGDDTEAPLQGATPKDAYQRWLENTEEHLKWNRVPEGYIQVTEPKYILRPEAIESVFYMYRITGDRTWQEKGWKMFEAVEKLTKTPIAHSAINNVLAEDGMGQLDSMESFWLAETLKYFYLLFSEPDVISLDDYVLNTEAHPLLRPKSKSRA